jgi:formate hydrogenlyase subunit 6/NADH:ubiquinone oxidoreductase subunit I
VPYEIKDECVVCWACIDICPVEAISECEIQVTPKYTVPGVKINNDECTDCGLCVEVCPVDAIVRSA